MEFNNLNDNKLRPYKEKIKKIIELYIQRLTNLVKSNAILINEKKELEFQQMEIKKEIDLTVEKHSLVEKNLENIKKEFQEYKEKYSKGNEEYKEKYIESNNKINELENISLNLSNTIEQLNSDNKKIQFELNQNNSEKEILLQNIKEFEIKIKNLEEENILKNQKITNLNKEIEDFKNKSELDFETKQNCEKLKLELEQKTQDIKQRNELLEFIDSQIISLENVIANSYK
jgi:hypothetical protein